MDTSLIFIICILAVDRPHVYLARIQHFSNCFRQKVSPYFSPFLRNAVSPLCTIGSGSFYQRQPHHIPRPPLIRPHALSDNLEYCVLSCHDLLMHITLIFCATRYRTQFYHLRYIAFRWLVVRCWCPSLFGLGDRPMLESSGNR